MKNYITLDEFREQTKNLSGDHVILVELSKDEYNTIKNIEIGCSTDYKRLLDTDEHDKYTPSSGKVFFKKLEINETNIDDNAILLISNNLK